MANNTHPLTFIGEIVVVAIILVFAVEPVKGSALNTSENMYSLTDTINKTINGGIDSGDFFFISNSNNQKSDGTSKYLAKAINKVWVCRYCGKVKKDPKRPSSERCSARNAPHGWEDVGESGSKKYVCNKCGKKVSVKTYARSTGCPKGGSHSWKENN